MNRLLIAGVAALTISVLVTRLEKTFQMSEEMQGYSAPFPPGIDEQRTVEQAAADRKNMGMIGGLIGAIVCSSLAFATLPGPLASSCKGAVAGIVFGAGMGAAGGMLSTIAFAHFMMNPLDPFIEGVLAQGSFTVAVSIGLAATLLLTASGRIRKQLPTVIVVVGVIASALYPFLSAVLFPLMKSHQVVPEGIANRVLWLGLPIILSAIAIARSLQPKAGTSLGQLGLADESDPHLVQPELRRLAEK